ncbi:hypothetical protein BOX08_gp02 [Pseudoalteromonas phage BS5]|uniref:hypothetical protein n=1 Tax=Pseudoalteromonas phage BS5 TaxID=1874539 RepID=UPI000819910B|nr:hypothetical protein BOX08_gp02 [Pseudoalteromonas phage BS5]ANY29567.1 hypothetical protein [Pseudoalteromonas phage BS5]
MKQYPYIGKSETNNIVLFTDEKTGFAIKNIIFKSGSFRGGWSETAFTNITQEYLSNTWGVVESKEHAEFIIDLAELHGFKTKPYKTSGTGIFMISGGELYFYSSNAMALRNDCKQITIPLPPKAKEEVKSYKFIGKTGEISINLPVTPKHFDCRCNKCGGICCAGFCDTNNELCKINTFAGVATIGKGKHKSRYGGNKTKAYKVWEGMITRCYVKGSAHYSRYGGRGVVVCDEWLDYQNFADWYFEQKNNSKSGFQIDKDLKVAGCKVYSPNTCEIIPSRVNSLLISTNSSRGDLPVGVHSLKNKFKASCRDEMGSKVHLGTFNSKTEAFSAYKNFKKGVVVTVANNEFDKGNISKRIYENLIRMEITPFPE